ncbi:MAG: hypothetical protein QM811_04005 [Pirellulales bacterium]
MLDTAFEALKTLDWGADLKPLDPIDAAIVASRADTAVRKDVETRLTAVLKSDAPARREGLCVPQTDGRRDCRVCAHIGRIVAARKTLAHWRGSRWNASPEPKRPPRCAMRFLK